jgi:NAD(P)-dependent dehydrogenase (short-subunit alcohol dehydrogenase family)
MYGRFSLKGKVALVTGGNGGIGLGMADALAEAGADVVIWGTNSAKTEQAAASLRAHGGRVETALVDVADETAVTQAMAETVASLGRLDACFANAGVNGAGMSFLDIGGEEYRRVMGVNLDGAMWTMREACRHMKARAQAGDPGGSIVCVSSLAALSGAARNEHYGASKAAVIGAVKGIAVEFARYGVRANAILPGWTTSELTRPMQENPVFQDKVMSRVPVKRWGAPEDFGGIAVYLASDASSFHTADAILIDGGYAAF